jgi:hypothetical protein
MLDILLNRRHALRIGALGALGLTLPQALRAAPARPRARSVILIYLGGGLSHLESFDLKPDAPAEVRGPFKQIDSNVPGVRICEHLPLMARRMDRLALIRSGAHENEVHPWATNNVLSGREAGLFGDYPSIGAVVSHELGFHGALPPYIAVPANPSFVWELGKSAFLGGGCESFKTGDPNDPNFRVRDMAPAESLATKRLDRRRSLLAAVDGLSRRVEQNDQLTTYDEFHRRAAAMILSSEARNAFVLDQENQRLRDRYGRTTFGQSCLLARRLVERGTRFVTVFFGGWDDHRGLQANMKARLPDLDCGLSALLDDLSERGLIADTQLVAFGEFGRTPKFNKDEGRDHWSPTASLLFAGAGVRGGQVIGVTDKQGAYVSKRPVSPPDVIWTVYEALGINPTKQLVTPDGRPIPLLERGARIEELYS